MHASGLSRVNSRDSLSSHAQASNSPSNLNVATSLNQSPLVFGSADGSDHGSGSRGSDHEFESHVGSVGPQQFPTWASQMPMSSMFRAGNRIARPGTWPVQPSLLPRVLSCPAHRVGHNLVALNHLEGGEAFVLGVLPFAVKSWGWKDYVPPDAVAAGAAHYESVGAVAPTSDFTGQDRADALPPGVCPEVRGPALTDVSSGVALRCVSYLATERRVWEPLMLALRSMFPDIPPAQDQTIAALQPAALVRLVQAQYQQLALAAQIMRAITLEAPLLGMGAEPWLRVFVICPMHSPALSLNARLISPCRPVSWPWGWFL